MLRPPAQNAGVVDDRAAVTGGTEVGKRRPGRTHDGGERDIEDTVPFVIGHIDHRGLPAQPGVVHQHVEPTQPGGGRGDQRIDLDRRRHVTHDALHPTKTQLQQRISGLGQTPLVVIGDHDVGALQQRTTGRRRPDPGTGSRGDDDDLAGQ